MSEPLYRRVTKGKRVTYEPYVDLSPPVQYDLTNEQMVTVAGSLGFTLLELFKRMLPPHKLIARKVVAVENSILELYRSTGQKIDDEVADWLCKCWDNAMHIAEFGADPIPTYREVLELRARVAELERVEKGSRNA